MHNMSFIGVTASVFWLSGYSCVQRGDGLRRYSTTVLPNGVHVWYKGIMSASTTTDGAYYVRFG